MTLEYRKLCLRRDHIALGARVGGASLILGVLASCGGGGGNSAAPTYTISASVTGLQNGKNVVLLDNGSDSVVISANGTVAFAKTVTSGGPYAVTIKTQPTGQTCSVSQGSGKVSSFNINVGVVCTANPYTVAVTVSGLLPGNSVTIQDNSADDITISSNGTYTFRSTVLSGAAYAVTVSAQPPGQNCVVTNGGGTVAGSNISNVGVTCSALPYTISVNVVGLANVSGLVLQDNGKDNLPLVTSGTYNFNLQVPSGSNYAVTILTQPTGRNCIVTNPNGVVASANVSVTVVCPEKVLYVVTNGNSVSAYYIDAMTGSLTSVQGSPFSTGTGAGQLMLAPNGKFAYVLNTGGNTISAYAIDPISGALSNVAGSPYLLGSVPHSLAITPNGSLLFVLTGGTTNVTAFSVDALTGALSTTSGSPFSVDLNASYIASGTAGFVYTVNRTNATVTGYTVNNGSGVLAPIPSGTWTVGTTPMALEVDPTGRFAYVPDLDGSVFAESVDPNSGVLTAVGGIAAGLYPTALSIDSLGRYVYAVDSGIGEISGYNINSSTGALANIGGSPFSISVPGGGMPRGIAIDTTDNLAYVSSDVGIIGFTFNATTGALVLIAGGRTGISLANSIAIASIQ